MGEASSSSPGNLNRAALLRFGLGVGLFGITLALYWPVRSFDFIAAYDDQKYVTENPMVRNGLTLESIRWAFTTGYASNWHPLTWISHMLDVQFWGIHAGAHHLVNLCLHAASTLLLFVVFRQYTGTLWRSAFVAALFAWHPLHVESVAWIAERKDVLSTFFLMLTLWAYRQYARPESTDVRAKFSQLLRSRFYLLGLAAFAFGLMSKPMVVTTPFLLLLLDYWPLNRHIAEGWRPLVLEKVPYLILSAASSAITFLVQQAGGAVASLESLSLSERAANAVVSYIRYLAKAVWPEPLAIPYPFTGVWPVHIVLGALFLLGGTSVVAWVSRRRLPYLPVGWFWFLGTLVPVIGLVQVGGQSMADRYTYVPLIGIFVIAAWGVAELAQQSGLGRGVAIASACAALLLCTARTSEQLPLWQNSVVLFRHAVTVTANNATAHVNLGKALAAEGKFQEALAQYQAGLSIRPADAAALNDVGNLFLKAGKPETALQLYHRAVALKPAEALFYYGLGNAHAALGRAAEASEAYQQGLKLNPRYAPAHTALAMSLAKAGRMQEAWTHAVRSVELDANLAETHNVLGNLHAVGERYEQAVASYRDALRLDPRMAGVSLNLGFCLSRLGRTNEAVAALELGLQINPGLWQAHAQLADLHASQGNFPKAVENAEQALEIAEKTGLSGNLDALRQKLVNYRNNRK